MTPSPCRMETGFWSCAHLSFTQGLWGPCPGQYLGDKQPASLVLCTEPWAKNLGPQPMMPESISESITNKDEEGRTRTPQEWRCWGALRRPAGLSLPQGWASRLELTPGQTFLVFSIVAPTDLPKVPSYFPSSHLFHVCWSNGANTYFL